jgi:hypothetical protein
MATVSRNTGITGGMNVPNNHVPRRAPGNTGVTGGMNVPNNKIPASDFTPAASNRRGISADNFVRQVDAATNVGGAPLTYVSESDFPVNVTDLGRAPKSNTGAASFKALESILTDGVFADVINYKKELTFDAQRGAAALAELASSGGGTEGAEKQAWKKLNDLAKRLTDVTFVKIGPKGRDGKLAEDAGLYAYALTGKTTDGRLVAIHFGSVET